MIILLSMLAAAPPSMDAQPYQPEAPATADGAKLTVTAPALPPAPPGGSPAFVTGNELHSQCTGSTDEQLICAGYIVGVADGANTTADTLDRRFLCLPVEVTRGQIKDIAVAYIGDHPEKRHFSAGSLILTALMTAFPCSDSQ
jgi:hypothetical protein